MAIPSNVITAIYSDYTQPFKSQMPEEAADINQFGACMNNCTQFCGYIIKCNSKYPTVLS